MSFLVRRSLPSLLGLVALLMGAGFVAVPTLGAPMWFPVAFAIALVGVQYLVNPRIIEWLVPASIVPHDDRTYATDLPLGRIVADRCAQAGIPLVKLGIVDDGSPNAFTFGRTRSNARIWVTRGLLERLDDRELDAVIAHEIGHIKHYDFIVMTVAAVVPMTLYLIYVLTRSGRREVQSIALGAYVAYVISEFTVLALSRARELSADHWSCKATGGGDALCAALVKIAYCMGVESGRHKDEIAMMIERGGKGKREASKYQGRIRRAQSMRAMGIFEPRVAEAMQAAFRSGVDPDQAVTGIRWEIANPWAKVLEKASSHPLVARRIAALESSGLPGTPTTWSVLRSIAVVPPEQRFAARTQFVKEAALSTVPWIALISITSFGAFTGSPTSVGLAVMIAGILLVAKQLYRYPAGFKRVTDGIPSMLERLDAGPVRGIPIELHGTIIGRGMPGYVLSADMAMRDDAGFLPLIYRQPIPFGRLWFGMTQVKHYIGARVVARGWYRRTSGPSLELLEVVTENGPRAFCWEKHARMLGSALVLIVGVVIVVVALSRPA